MKPLNLLLIKPAGPDCNLDCAYCFYLQKAAQFPESSVHRMNEQVLEEMIRQALGGHERHVSFVWQGGEPTLMGLPFFKRAVALQQKYGNGKTVSNGLQTNGLLLDADWADFLRDYRFLVGLSIDGPEHVHDHYRLHKGGQGSWARAVESVKLLLQHGVEVNAISVVTEYSAAFADEIYRFHKSIGLNYMQFIPCIERDASHPARIAPYSVSPEKYGAFLIRLFDQWQSDFRGAVATTSVRFFDSVFHTYVGLEAPECTLRKNCGGYLTVEHNGDVFACDFFVTPEWQLGNVLTRSLQEMLNGPTQQAFVEAKALLPAECMQCSWLRMCRGGCTKDRLTDILEEGKTYFCESYKMFFAHADERFTKLAREWTKGTSVI
jgi:uncharacterized protein